MAPVRPSRRRDARALALAIGGLVLVAALLGLFVWGLPRLSESGRVEVKLGADTFDAGQAEPRARSIAADGPLLFSDVAGGERDIFVQHLGSDPATGWYAFDARLPGSPRTCTFRWDAAAGRFVDPCNGATIAADGDGVPRYAVQVDADGHVMVDLKPKANTTSSSLPITGGTLR